jgi:hypothetical protein
MVRTNYLCLLSLLVFAGCSDSHGSGDSGVDGSVDDSGTDGSDRDTGTPPAYDECAAPSDCVLTANTCCGVCGAPTRDDVAAVNVDMRMDYYLDVACPEARTAPPPCPDCPSALNPNLFATCTGGACAVVDLATDPGYAECVEDSDCIVRARDCCECGADVSLPNLVAIAGAQRAAFEAVVCDPGTGCPECAPAYPEEIGAACNMGVCALTEMMSMP